MLFPDLEQIKNLSQNYTLVPVSKSFYADMVTPISLFKALGTKGYSFLLESVEGGEKWGRYSFMGRKPSFRVESHGNKNIIHRADGETEIVMREPLKFLNSLLAELCAPTIQGLPRFNGGAVGFIGYDIIRTVEFLPNIPKDEMGLPDLHLMFFDEIIAFDHLKQKVHIIINLHTDRDIVCEYGNAEKRIEEISKQIYSTGNGSISTTTETLCFNGKLQGDDGRSSEQDVIQKSGSEQNDPIEEIQRNSENTTNEINKANDSNDVNGANDRNDPHLSLGGFTCKMKREEYIEKVNKAKEYIRNGDIFQVVLSQRFEAQATADPLNVYRALRSINPSPYMFYLDFESYKLVGASPEMLVRVENGMVETCPIAGTRKRGKTVEEDLFLENELKNDEKEMSEHTMLVDLGRNDIGKISKFNTVEVKDFMHVEKFSHVMHLVTNVKGELSEGVKAADAIASVLPAGTLSGAPKVRAMEIIDELEPLKRCAYGGAVGYIGYDGSLDSCITIRTMVFKDDKVFVQAGGGIVADSIPELEYEECINKARALINAYGEAEKL